MNIVLGLLYWNIISPINYGKGLSTLSVLAKRCFIESGIFPKLVYFADYFLNVTNLTGRQLCRDDRGTERIARFHFNEPKKTTGRNLRARSAA
jgi:hypothetical protein